MKIIVFGSNGMLGRYVSTYFQKNDYEVINLTRSDFDLTNVTKKELNDFLVNKRDGVVINCAGAIVQKYSFYGAENMIKINSVFPWMLSDVCKKNNIKLIHITTDCVFSGLKGMYDEDDFHDPIDVYGKSKSLGEPDYGTIIRTSIIGEELEGKKSFIEWVKSEKGNTVNGFKRNIWNGISCLQFAKICHKIVKENLFWNGIRHFSSPDAYIKGELIEVVSEIYDLNLTVKMVDLPLQLCDRTISTKYQEFISEFNIPPIKEQIQELKNFSLNEKNSEHSFGN